jgi:large subunit ribosomal protein L25
VLEVTIGGKTLLVAPRDVQKDPVKRVLEHVDLVIVSKAEAAERVEAGLAAEAAAEAAHEAELEAAAHAPEMDLEAHLDSDAAPADDAAEADEA